MKAYIFVNVRDEENLESLQERISKLEGIQSVDIVDNTSHRYDMIAVVQMEDSNCQKVIEEIQKMEDVYAVWMHPVVE